jgi:NitT/TauT family transport system substrate-binding protein
MIKPRILLALLLCMLLPLGGSCASQTKKTRLVIAQVGDFFLYAPLYIALDAGFFNDQGLDVSIVTTGGDDKTWASVISNSAQLGISDPTFVVASAQRGQPGRVIASIVNGVPFWGVTWRTDLAPVRSGTDLRNLRVATFPAPSTAYVLQERMFKDAGLPATITQGGFGSLLSIIRAGKADIALELEPNVSQAVADGARVLYSMKGIYGDFAITGLTATPEFVRDNSVTLMAATCGLQKALDLIHQDPQRVLTMLRKRFPDVRPEVASDALDRATKDGIIPSTLLIPKAAWQKAVDLRRSVGDLTDPGSFSVFVDNRFAQQALRGCH